MSAVLRLERLTKRYGSVVAVDAVDAEIREGELVSFVGPSGCGKTTFLRILGGLEAPTSGALDVRIEHSVPRSGSRLQSSTKVRSSLT